MQIQEQRLAKTWRATALAAAITCSISMSALAAPPDDVNNFTVGQFDSLTIDAKMNIFSAGREEAVDGTSCTAATEGPAGSEHGSHFAETSAGILPTEIPIPPNAVWVSFETVTKASDFGSTHHWRGGQLQVDPTYHSGDGWSPLGEAVTTIVPTGVDVSGISAHSTLFLTGVFRNDDAPQSSGGPAARDYRVAYGTTAGTWNSVLGIYGNWSTRFDNDIQNIFVNTNEPTYDDILLNQTFWVGDGRDKFEVFEGPGNL